PPEYRYIAERPRSVHEVRRWQSSQKRVVSYTSSSTSRNRRNLRNSMEPCSGGNSRKSREWTTRSSRRQAVRVAASGASNQATGSRGSSITCPSQPVEKFDKAKLKQQLSPLQYDVVVNKGTERPFTGEYWDNHDAGVYLCVVCGTELFASGTKFDSRTGWPSFWAPVQEGNVR